MEDKMFDFNSMSVCSVKWDWYGNRDQNPTSLTLATDGVRFFVTCFTRRFWKDYLDDRKIVSVPLPEELRGLPAYKLAYYQDVLLPLLKAARKKEESQNRLA